jgi:hypothetical protein
MAKQPDKHSTCKRTPACKQFRERGLQTCSKEWHESVVFHFRERGLQTCSKEWHESVVFHFRERGLQTCSKEWHESVVFTNDSHTPTHIIITIHACIQHINTYNILSVYVI